MVIGEPPLVSTLRVYVPQNSSRLARRILPLILVDLSNLADCSSTVVSLSALVTLSDTLVIVVLMGVTVLAIVVDSMGSVSSMVWVALSVVTVIVDSVVTTSLPSFSTIPSTSVFSTVGIRFSSAVDSFLSPRKCRNAGISSFALARKLVSLTVSRSTFLT